MNPLVRKILGEDVPVPVAAKRQPSAREGERREHKREPERESARTRRSRQVAGVIGMMTEEEEIFPKNAQEIENTEGTPGSMAGIAPIKDFIAEPTDPYSNGEKVYSPATALVAPDVTPNATKPLDPSKMPGVHYGTFNSSQTEPAVPAAVPAAAPDAAAPPNAMEILLGRARGSAATASPPTREGTDNIPVTAESAAAMMGVTPGMFSSTTPLVETQAPQPPPQEKADIRGACDLARRWMP